MLYLCGLVFGSCGLHLPLQDRRRMFAFVHALERPDGIRGPVATLGFKQSAVAGSGTRVTNFGLEGFFVGAKLSTNWI